MHNVVIIPARGGSKGIPKKNIINLNGLPLIAYTIKAAINSGGLIDRIIISTDDNQIAEISREYGGEVFMRSESLSTDTASTHDVLIDISNTLDKQNYKVDNLITLQPTSPLRDENHIKEAINLFCKNKIADSLVSCIQVPHIFHPYSVMKLSKEGFLNNFIKDAPSISRRQDKQVVFARNGAAIYITRFNRINNYIFGGKILPFFMKPEDSIDIDSFEDLKKIEKILQDRNAKNSKLRK